MKTKININVDVRHLTRVEGHGDIHIQVKDGELVEAKWAVVETPRFFEVMLRGKSHDMAPILTSRICGICSIGHSLASIRAIERAMGIEVPKNAKLLRLLAKHGETLQSHVLHVFFLSIPDFFGVDSVLPLIKSHPQLAQVAVALKGLGNEICELVGGRAVHPVTLIAGGLSKAPKKAELEQLRDKIKDNFPLLLKIVEVFNNISMPDFERETEFVSLKGEGSYPWIGGALISSDGVQKDENDYLAMTNEYQVDFSTSKHTRLSRSSFAVGALARFNNNCRFLQPKAQEIAAELRLASISHNPFMNNIAQIVECYHVMLEAIEIIDELLASNLKDIYRPYDIKGGEGISAVEVPRGILYHHYWLNEEGIVTKANCIIPTTQNNANIHNDLAELAKAQVDKGRGDKEIRLLSEMLVRSYDPCISCSVH